MSCTTSKPDPLDALHQDAKSFPGIPGDPTRARIPEGITGIARLIGRSAGILHNKFSQADERYEINVREALAIGQIVQATTGSTAFAEAVASHFGGIFVALPPDGMAADDDVLTAMLDSVRSLGDLARELTEARADGVITADEYAALELRGKRLQGTLHYVLQTLKTQIQPEPAPAAQGQTSLRTVR